jgi:hypothetical protein
MIDRSMCVCRGVDGGGEESGGEESEGWERGWGGVGWTGEGREELVPTIVRRARARHGRA